MPSQGVPGRVLPTGLLQQVVDAITAEGGTAKALREAGLGDVGVVVGGIVPDEDERALLDAGPAGQGLQAVADGAGVARVHREVRQVGDAAAAVDEAHRPGAATAAIEVSTCNNTAMSPWGDASRRHHPLKPTPASDPLQLP